MIFDAASSADKTIQLIPGGAHLLFFGPNRGVSIGHITSWLQEREKKEGGKWRLCRYQASIMGQASFMISEG